MSFTRTSITIKKNIIIVGDFNTGKSSILHRLVKKEFNKGFTNTSLDFCSYDIKHNDENLHVFIWDSLGHERFKSMTDSFYKKANGAIIIFDLTEEHYKESIEKWIRTISENCAADIPIVIAGNKRDITMAYEKKLKDVSESLKELPNVIDLMSISAKTGDNIPELFYTIIVATFESSKEPVSSPAIDNSEPSTGCCDGCSIL